MAKVVLFGDSYIKRLCFFCDERKGLHVPYSVKWYGQCGLRTDRMNTDLYGKMLKEKGAGDKNSTRPLVLTSEILKGRVNFPKALVLQDE
ncbi:hypothetical protein DPMN_019724 [Dreissena polymorpha]|uniref:Uncharacterized protein n=1 Tax=Dreissena polymorpha TaxID=45954 RepID=A0A9D4S7K8_DREPO|nr:hypothetical protein DPMN_019724 [Dreissena polymorpha]